jgi:hypothetical protein
MELRLCSDSRNSMNFIYSRVSFPFAKIRKEYSLLVTEHTEFIPLTVHPAALYLLDPFSPFIVTCPPNDIHPPNPGYFNFSPSFSEVNEY